MIFNANVGDTIRLTLYPYLYSNTTKTCEVINLQFYIYDGEIVAPLITNYSIINNAYIKFNATNNELTIYVDINCSPYYVHYSMDCLKYRETKFELKSFEIIPEEINAETISTFTHFQKTSN